MGGDGTLNETINGLAQANSAIHFGFIPLGTINDLARALNIPLHPEAAIAMLQHCKTVKVDIAKANDRYFVNTIAAGIMPEAVGHVSIEQKTRLGPLVSRPCRPIRRRCSRSRRPRARQSTARPSSSPC